MPIVQEIKNFSSLLENSFAFEQEKILELVKKTSSTVEGLLVHKDVYTGQEKKLKEIQDVINFLNLFSLQLNLLSLKLNRGGSDDTSMRYFARQISGYINDLFKNT